MSGIREDGRIVHEAIWGPMIVLGAVLAVFFPERVPRIPCGFKWLTDIPCLACGSTRAVMRLAAFDPIGALVMNPLTTLLAIATGLYAIHAALVLAGARRPWRFDPKTRRFARARWVAAIVVAINWSYLVLAGR